MTLDLLSVVPAAARYERQPIPNTENALAPWTEAIHHFRDRGDQDRVCSELIYGTEDGQPVEMPQGDEYERVSALLDENRRAFDLIDDGIRRGRLQLPPVSGLEAFLNEERQLVCNWHRINQLRTIRRDFLLHEGDVDAAATECVQILRLGEMICNGEGMLVDYLVGVWSRNAGIGAVQHLATHTDVAAGTLRYLLGNIKQSRDREDGLVETERIELCCYTLPQLECMPEESNIELLIDKLLELYYDSHSMAKAGPESIFMSEISPETRERRVTCRRNQLLFLLKGHPRPFDKGATARLVAQRVSDFIAWVTSTRRRQFWKLYAKWRRRTAPLRNRSQRRVARAWPTLLSPGIPFDFFGEDLQAEANREAMASLSERRFRGAWKPPSEKELASARTRLLQMDNPVGLILQSTLHATDEAASEWVFRYWQDLRVAQQLIEKRLKRGTAKGP